MHTVALITWFFAILCFVSPSNSVNPSRFRQDLNRSWTLKPKCSRLNFCYNWQLDEILFARDAFNCFLSLKSSHKTRNFFIALRLKLWSSTQKRYRNLTQSSCPNCDNPHRHELHWVLHENEAQRARRRVPQIITPFFLALSSRAFDSVVVHRKLQCGWFKRLLTPVEVLLGR